MSMDRKLRSASVWAGSSVTSVLLPEAEAVMVFAAASRTVCSSENASDAGSIQGRAGTDQGKPGAIRGRKATELGLTAQPAGLPEATHVRLERNCLGPDARSHPASTITCRPSGGDSRDVDRPRAPHSSHGRCVSRAFG